MQSKILTAFCLCLVFAFPAFAADIQLNGFASVVMGIDIEDDGEDAGLDESPYNERTVDNLQESKVALQWTANLEPGIRFVGQTMARGNASSGFDMNYDWAYFDFNVGDSGKFKAGRLRIPFYKYSDYLDVGYAYHWITPPESMYSLSFSNMDGIGYQQNFEGMGLEQSVNVVLGSYQGDLSIATETVASKLENLMAVNWSASMGDHEFYAAYAQADVYMPATLLATATAIAADGNDVSINGDYGHFVGIGYKGAFGDAALFAEYSMVGIDDSILSDSAGGYIGVSYNMDDYTYHLTYGFSKSDSKSIDAASSVSLDLNQDGNVDAIDNAFAQPTLDATTESLGEGDDSTITLGVRKDVGASTALKLELSMYTEDKIQVAGDAAKSEKEFTTLKFAIETMF